MKLPWWVRRCRCRSYHARTGSHVPDCPRWHNANWEPVE